jgi:hypothetical protein
MNSKILFISCGLAIVLFANAQRTDIPATIILKDGKSVEAAHFGQDKCGTDNYSNDYVLIRGQYMNTLTEMKDYSDIEKIILIGYKDKPVASVGNEKGRIEIIKKNGVSVTLEEAEISMSCYGVGDMYNTIIIKIINPLTNQAAEQIIETKNIQSVIFK